MKHCIQYKSWMKKERNELYKSAREILYLQEPQLYIPIMSLYFYIHNTPQSHKILDFKRTDYINKVLSSEQIKDYNSNILLDASVTNNKTTNNTTLFAKVIPLLDPIHYLLNNYNNTIHRNPLLPSNYSFNTFSKLNDMNNMAYIDIFFSYIASEVTLHDKNPSFPKYYGSLNGLGNYIHDVSEDIDELKYHKGFNNQFNKTFTLKSFISTDSPSSRSRNSSRSSNSYRSRNSSRTSNSQCSSSNSSNIEDIVAVFHKFPIGYLFIEKLDGTLEDIIQQELSLPLLKSCLFQIAFALLYLQKNYKFTHNDLHINNVMYISTNKPYLYYKLNNKYFKVPTYGYLFKIIDFGRSIFTIGKKTFMNDCFSKYGEADGQYTHPPQVNFLNIKYDEFISPSYNFDLCRLAMTMIDEIRYNHDDELEYETNYINFLKFLKYLVTDKEGQRLDKLDDNFDLYIKIAKNSVNTLPKDVLVNPFFYEYRVKKKEFPKSTYYSV